MNGLKTRYMALDLGDKRIGIAVSDPFNEYALPVSTYTRVNLAKDIAFITRVAKEKGITAFVCGLPVFADGTESVQTRRAAYFIEKLREASELPVFTADERYTTIEAHRTLIEEGFSREKRKTVVDSLAAASILDGFLSSVKNGKTPTADHGKEEIKKENEEKEKIKMDEKEKETCGCGCEEHVHTHDEDCDCGCEEDVVELEGDNGEKYKFHLIDMLEHGGRKFVALAAAEPVEGLEDDCIVIYELDEKENVLMPVEDDKLLDEVYEEFCRMEEEDACDENCDECEDEDCVCKTCEEENCDNCDK